MWEALQPWIFPVACVGCDVAGIALCDACAPGPADRLTFVVADTGVAAAGAYAGVLRRAIVAMKRGERAYLAPLAGALAANLTFDAPLVPLPTGAGRRAARGFDQGVEVARRAARLQRLGCCEVLEKRGGAQRGLDRLARLAAVGRFRVRPGVALPPRAVAVDDVCTTGATLTDGICALRAAGVDVIGAAVLARA